MMVTTIMNSVGVVWLSTVLLVIPSSFHCAHIKEVGQPNMLLRLGDTIVTNKKEINNINKLRAKEEESEKVPADDANVKDSRNPEQLHCNLDQKVVTEIRSYRKTVQEILDYITIGEFKGKTYQMLAELTDTFGPRMTGTKDLEAAIDWAVMKFKENRLENVHTESVLAPNWVRNNESLHLIQPRPAKLNILGIGDSVGTPPGGITAEVLVVKSFEELQNHKVRANGKIVVFNADWTTYGNSVQYRAFGAAKAVQFGALAVLVRSATPFSMNTPHTGWQLYEESSRKIPAACITVEDAEMLHRFQDRGETVLVTLEMSSENLAPVVSRNIVADVMGYERPEEIVAVSGHLDSWDVGVGAMDDGGGSMISWTATSVLKELGLRARRTIRTVLFTAEEQGLYGAKAYFELHNQNLEKYQLFLESDTGTFSPIGMSISGTKETQCIMKEVLNLMKSLNATQLISPMIGGPDIQVWERAGVPTGSMLNDDTRYFWFHHSAGDTMEVEESSALDKCAALWTAVAFIVADMNINLPHHMATV